MAYSMTNRATAAIGAVLLCLGTMAWLSRPVTAVTRAVTNRTAGVATGFDRDGLISIDTARAEGASSEALKLALNSVACASSSGAIERPATLTLIDYSRPSVEPRLWVFDLRSGELLFKELVTAETVARASRRGFQTM
jgi:L,D-transpeptidase catalytic domain